MNKATKNPGTKPEELTDGDLEHAAGGGYTEVEWTYLKPGGKDKNQQPAKDDPKGIAAQSGTGSI